MDQHAPASFTASAARLADYGHRVPSRFLQTRIAWPLAVAVVTACWAASFAWDAASRLLRPLTSSRRTA